MRVSAGVLRRGLLRNANRTLTRPADAADRGAATRGVADDRRSDPYPLSNNDAGNLAFEFPASGSMHYLFTPSILSSIRGTPAVTVRVTTTGPVIFNSLDPLSASCSIPASVRPFFWSNQNGNGSYDRWWSNPRAFSLASGAGTIAVPLTAES